MLEKEKGPKEWSQEKVLYGRMGVELRAYMDRFTLERRNFIALKYKETITSSVVVSDKRC